MEPIMQCRHCGYRASYRPRAANFVLLCPVCKNSFYSECEYGYGPATPCKLYLQDSVAGTVDRDQKGGYILTSPLLRRPVRLNGKYLDALKDAVDRIRPLL